MKISKKQKAVLKSYARGVLVSFLTFLDVIGTNDK